MLNPSRYLITKEVEKKVPKEIRTAIWNVIEELSQKNGNLFAIKSRYVFTLKEVIIEGELKQEISYINMSTKQKENIYLDIDPISSCVLFVVAQLKGELLMTFNY
ncbi:hypothetical protein [Caldibacillus thermoamylovorans]|uniref:hypothetical protein n=1 Tax=Caldibacillus thermoamylovorans TaxID=35841 RepID=UPI00203BDE75|nr:hypothetical protein [Caldibacillus thermoamylovorans]MCM3478955.1 hypothetical protein [Caldibacillus thermoamylovorans]